MGLKGYTLPTQEIELPGGDKFTVRGLSLPDIITVVQNYAEPVQSLFAKYTGTSATDLALDDLGAIGTNILNAAPELAAAIISMAADEPGEAGTVGKLPFPVQIEALEAVGKLTFDTAGGPKKVVETVIRVFRGTTDLMVDLRMSKAGSLASGDK